MPQFMSEQGVELACHGHFQTCIINRSADYFNLKFLMPTLYVDVWMISNFTFHKNTVKGKS